MPRRIAIALAVLLTVIIVAYFLRPLGPVRFQNRALVPMRGFERYLYRLPTRKDAATHTDAANKSLILRTPSVVDHPEWLDPDPTRFTFPCLLAMALGLDCRSDADAAAQALIAWIDTGDEAFYELNCNWTHKDPNRSLASIPLIPLAVVNRMDLAAIGCEPDNNCNRPVDPSSPCQSGAICGAEIRFVYAGVPLVTTGHYFTLILEFTLPQLQKSDFIALARQWDAQTSLQDDPTTANPAASKAFANNAGKVLSYCFQMPGIKARMRISGRKDQTWQLRQFVAANGKLTPQNLFQQPARLIQADDQCQEKGISPLADFASTNPQQILISKYAFDLIPQLGTTTFPLNSNDTNVFTLADDVAAAGSLESLRQTLSLNSCAGCHGLETKQTIGDDTPFDQIRFRSAAGQQSHMAPFLTGDNSGEPSLSSYQIDAPVIKSGGCSGSGSHQHRYNDLLRRDEYLQTVLSLSASDNDAAWYQKLNSFAVASID